MSPMHTGHYATRSIGIYESLDDDIVLGNLYSVPRLDCNYG
jgi:hypothetical protein